MGHWIVEVDEDRALRHASAEALVGGLRWAPLAGAAFAVAALLVMLRHPRSAPA